MLPLIVRWRFGPLTRTTDDGRCVKRINPVSLAVVIASHQLTMKRARIMPTNARCNDAPPDGLLEGIAMYNRGEYYECHEILEDIWRAEPDDVRYLYQGILQIGVAFHHLGNGNWRGARGLLTGGIEKVSRFEPDCMGVETLKLVAQARACLEQLHALGPEGVDSFDWSTVPRISVLTTEMRGDNASGDR